MTAMFGASGGGPATVTGVGGPTTVIELAGVRFLTDPTFDPPGPHPVGNRILTKLAGPSKDPAAILPVDAVLLSHDQHPDNFDEAGRAVAARAPRILTTPAAADRLRGNAVGLEPWQSAVVTNDAGATVAVTAVPAQHGPPNTEDLTGPVTGFVLEAAGTTIYVSGDNASLDLVREVAERFPAIDVAVLFGGAARTPLLGDAYLTLTAAQLVEAAHILKARQVVAAHVAGWAHFTESVADVEAAFSGSGIVAQIA
jgi:L-ascorbate metabolism protein UlaG (beta-lactamase superfamily)